MKPMKTAEEYRARVIQLESFLARIQLTAPLEGKNRRIYDYVQSTSIALTEDYDPVARHNRPWQRVTPLEELVAGAEPRRLPDEETTCAGCGEPVDPIRSHVKFSAAYGRRRGRFHTSCLPLEGLDKWLLAEGERLSPFGPQFY